MKTRRYRQGPRWFLAVAFALMLIPGRTFGYKDPPCHDNVTTSCLGGSVILTNLTINLKTNCLGEAFNASVTQEEKSGTKTTYHSCPASEASESVPIGVLSNAWIATVGSWTNTGTQFPAAFNPGDCGGNGKVKFTTYWTNGCTTNIHTTIADTNFTVVGVASLTTDIPSGHGGLEDGSDPPTYWVCPCAGDIIVTATSCPGFSTDELPDCWTFTGGVEIDKLHHKVSKAALASGDVTFTVTCGTSTKTIVLRIDPERDKYDAIGASANCGCIDWVDPSPFHDKCGNSLAIDCTGHLEDIFGICIAAGHIEYRYNGIWVGTCYYPNGNNFYLYKTTKHSCRILRTWHLTQQPTSPTLWTVTKYNCLTGSGPSQNCRSAPSWNYTWAAPADETHPGYPANSCENQGTPSTPCPPEL